jgi:DGQHR domain-containing protein
MKNFIKISALEVLQLNSKSGAVYTARITFNELLQIRRLTERKESTYDPFGERSISSNIIEEEEEFQRHLNKSKLNDISNYLKDEFDKQNEGIIYPSSVILSLDINEDDSDKLNEDKIDSSYYNGLNSCYTIDNNGITSIYIPKTKRICLIVDGQHRFSGLKKFYDETKDSAKKEKILNFQFIATILLGYDPFQVAEVFANVNFNQKPVNKSLYYDIFGSAAKEKNEIQLAHFLALHMQNNELSPLNGMIKLLGKGYGLFSQALKMKKCGATYIRIICLMERGF